MNAIDVLHYGQQTVMSTIGRYGPDDWNRIALGVWTAKDLLGHLGAFEVRFADILATFVDEPVESDLLSADLETFNDDQAAIRATWSIEQVVDEFVAAHDRAMRHARTISAERWREVGTIPWYGPSYALDDLVVYTIYSHKREHDPQLSAALETQPA
ncbi:MAG: DinB family protein [Candidatus Limnocylindrales bacterium]